MSSFAGVDLFGSGPHEFRFGSWTRQTVRRGLSGLDGELILDLGRRSRTIHQTGRLQQPTADALAAALEAIEDLADGSAHELIDVHGRSHPQTVLEAFETTSPVRAGRGFFCEYRATYRQLP